MFFWFIGSVTLIVMVIFRDPRFDYRLLAVGAVLPDIVDGTIGQLAGGALVLHSITASVVTLIVVMAATVGKRARRKQWLALPIGMFLHLVVDGAVDDARVFWWPLGGLSFEDARLPVVERGLWNMPLEVIGVLMVVWIWRRHGLSDPERRRWFRSTGQLVPATAPGGPPPMC
jgi:hypothetical protein